MQNTTVTVKFKTVLTNRSCKIFLGLKPTSYIQAADDSKIVLAVLVSLVKDLTEFNFLVIIRGTLFQSLAADTANEPPPSVSHLQ